MRNRYVEVFVRHVAVIVRQHTAAIDGPRDAHFVHEVVDWLLEAADVVIEVADDRPNVRIDAPTSWTSVPTSRTPVSRRVV